MVQLEAMSCGTPVVASDLPGVRTIVQNTGMGLICHRGDPESLADCISKVLKTPGQYIKPPEKIRQYYSEEKTINVYGRVMESLVQEANSSNC